MREKKNNSTKARASNQGDEIDGLAGKATC